jgi:hypothetical protein
MKNFGGPRCPEHPWGGPLSAVTQAPCVLCIGEMLAIRDRARGRLGPKVVLDETGPAVEYVSPTAPWALTARPAAWFS